MCSNLAAYPPDYKIITVKNDSKLRVETVVLDTVPNFDSFFVWYKKAFDFIQAHLSEFRWNGNILASKSYLEFTNFHLQELVRLHFLPDDWPDVLREDLLNQSGWQLLLKSCATDSSTTDLNSSKLKEKVLKTLNRNQLDAGDFKSWNGQDLILDFYRFRNADQLA